LEISTLKRAATAYGSFGFHSIWS